MKLHHDEYINDEILDRIKELYIDCPECETIILGDEQYSCTLCEGSGRLSVYTLMKEQFDKSEKEINILKDKQEDLLIGLEYVTRVLKKINNKLNLGKEVIEYSEKLLKNFNYGT